MCKFFACYDFENHLFKELTEVSFFDLLNETIHLLDKPVVCNSGYYYNILDTDDLAMFVICDGLA